MKKYNKYKNKYKNKYENKYENKEALNHKYNKYENKVNLNKNDNYLYGLILGEFQLGCRIFTDYHRLKNRMNLYDRLNNNRLNNRIDFKARFLTITYDNRR